MATMAINTASAGNMPPAMFHKNLPFAQLKNDALARFEAIAPEASRSRGETLFVEGETPRYVFLICSGRVKLSVSSREGRRPFCALRGPVKSWVLARPWAERPMKPLLKLRNYAG